MAPDLLIVCQRLAALCDLTDEAIAATMCRFNEAWSLWIIAVSSSFSLVTSWPGHLTK